MSRRAAPKANSGALRREGCLMSCKALAKANDAVRSKELAR